MVTGSTAGIGRAIAVEFAAPGARVLVTGRDPARGDAVAAAARKAGEPAGGDAEFLAADLVDEAACNDLIETRGGSLRWAHRAGEQRRRRRRATTARSASSTPPPGRRPCG